MSMSASSVIPVEGEARGVGSGLPKTYASHCGSLVRSPEGDYELVC